MLVVVVGVSVDTGERESFGEGEIGDDRVSDFAGRESEGLFFVFRAEGFSLRCENGRDEDDWR